MKKALTTLLPILTTIPAIAFVAFVQSPVDAQITLELNYPRPSEQFFKEGRQQLEREIQRLQSPPPATPLLTINPNLEQQMRMELQQREQGNQPTQSKQPQAPQSNQPPAQSQL